MTKRGVQDSEFVSTDGESLDGLFRAKRRSNASLSDTAPFPFVEFGPFLRCGSLSPYILRKRSSTSEISLCESSNRTSSFAGSILTS